MALELNPVIGIVEIANFLVNILLAFLVIRIGWRFTNIRAAKDLVLEEGRRSLDMCDKIRKDLRNFADSGNFQQSNLIDHLDDLGNNINNCKKMFGSFRNRSNLQLSKDLDEDYETLRIKISGGRSWNDLNTDTANTWVRKVEDRGSEYEVSGTFFEKIDAFKLKVNVIFIGARCVHLSNEELEIQRTLR